MNKQQLRARVENVKFHFNMILNPTECIHKCQLDPLSKYCIYCERTLEQISNWSKYSEKEKEDILTRKKFTKTRIINQHG